MTIRRLGPRCLLALALLLAGGCTAPPPTTDGHTVGLDRYPSARDLYVLAETYRLKHRLPALGVGVIHKGDIVGLGMAGERAVGTGDIAAIDDAYDVGSIAKSITGTIAALLVDDGRISWDTTLPEALPDLAGDLHPGYADVTLEALLQHRSGVGHALSGSDRWSVWHSGHPNQSPTDQRLAFTRATLRRPPRYTPGATAHYSSDAYVIAGTILERVAGRPWEQLAKMRLFDPLRLQSLRYGPVGADGRATPVLGHEPHWFGRSRAIPHNPAEYGSPPFGSPAGFLYASVPDLLRWLDFQIHGAAGRGALLSAATFRRLHSAADGQPFAIGWESAFTRGPDGGVLERSVYHAGHSGRFRANIWFVPETEWGTAIVSNSGGGNDDVITDDVFHALLREFGLASTAR
jgi:CubicO group peptidase (beta-lactamase class C family)